MPRKAESEPECVDQVRRALLEMSVNLLRAIEGLRQALAVKPKGTAKVAQPKVPKPPKTTGKPRGRRPMTPEQRAAAKAEREAKAAASAPVATAPRPKPQPVTRASLAAQQAVPQPPVTSYFTKAN